MNWKTWLKGLAAVAIGGAATGAAHAVGDGQVNANTAITAGIGALATVLAYMMQSPFVTGGSGNPPSIGTAPGQTEQSSNPFDSTIGK